MTRRAVGDPALLALYAIGACSVGAFVAVYNALGFRLTSAPFDLGLGAAGLVFLVYPVGTLGSMVAGRLADRFSRRAVVPVGCVIVIVGLLLTLSGSLPVVVLGLAVMTAGFFAVHGVASGWVATRAHAGGVAAGQAASLYLFAYYLGSSAFGSLTGHAWAVGRLAGGGAAGLRARPAQRAVRPLAPPHSLAGPDASLRSPVRGSGEKSGGRFSANAAGALHALLALRERLEPVEGQVGDAADVVGVGVERVLEELQRGGRVGADLRGPTPARSSSSSLRGTTSFTSPQRRRSAAS